MRRRFGLVVVAVALALVAVLPASAITYGTPDGDAHPYVGLVVFYDASGKPLWRCSGTLIAPTVFLTAGHCTFDTASAQVWFDPAAPAGYPVTGGVTGTPYAHPGYDDFASFPNTGDVGVVILDSPVYLDTYGVLADVGTLNSLAKQRGKQETRFTAVGYGLQGVKPVYQSDRVRYQGTVSLVNLNSALTDGYNIQVTANPGKGNGAGGTCFGDSGGPLFLYGTNAIVGVTSFGLNANCKGTSFIFRTDTASADSFIRSFLP
jgi:hypothetical protein